MTIFTGIVISKSLRNPSLLNGLQTLGVHIAEGQDTPAAPIWHLFKVKVNQDQITQITQIIAGNIKYGWYAHFWNGEIVYVCLEEKLFQLPQDGLWSSPEFHALKAYAIAHGVEERYLDLDLRD